MWVVPRANNIRKQRLPIWAKRGPGLIQPSKPVRDYRILVLLVPRKGNRAGPDTRLKREPCYYSNGVPRHHNDRAPLALSPPLWCDLVGRPHCTGHAHTLF